MNAAATSAVVEDVVAAVRPPGDQVDAAEVFARGAWTALVEPGDGTAGALVGAFGAAAALDALRLGTPPGRQPEVARGFERWAPRLDETAFLLAFRNAARIGARLVVPEDADWPAGLSDLGPHAPLALWVLARKGPLPRFERSVAVVGSRDATDYGITVTNDLACGLVDARFAVVSGGAHGIDGAAHRGALASGGLTIAVLAGGPDRFYPAEHEQLLHRIAREGVVLTEMPCGARPMRDRFLKRNRLIAAMTRATVVVEAGARSGARNTAGHAAELGRPIGAVPGPVTSATSMGTHAILRESDAVLIRGVADVVELARDPDAAVTLDGFEGLVEPKDPARRRVLDVLTRRPRTTLDIAARAGLSVRDTTIALGMLVLAGAASDDDGLWSRR